MVGQAIQFPPGSIDITYPKDGISAYGDVNITWNTFPGANGYTIAVSDMAD